MADFLDESKDPNMLFKARLKGESRLRILLSKKPAVEQAGGSVDASNDIGSTFMEGPKAFDELIPRKKGGIQFFDLGQVLVGSVYERIDYYFIDSLGTAVSGGIAEPTGGHFFSDFDTLILGISRDNFPTYYKKIKNATSESQMVTVSYTDDILGPVTTDLLTSPKFKNDKLMLSVAEAATLVTNMSNVGFATFWDRITALPDPTDTDISSGFTIKNKAEVYLIPQFIQQYFDSEYVNGVGNASTEYGAIGYFILDRALWPAFLTGLFMSSGYAKDWYNGNSVVVPNAGAHVLNQVWSFTGGVWTYSTSADPINPTYFNSSGVIVVDGNHYGQAIGTNFANYSSPHKGLRMVVHQDNQWYYLWNTTGTVI